MNDVTSWKVLCPVEGRGKTRWLRIGRAHRNKDGSTNIYLDALPANSRLQLREWEEDEGRPRKQEQLSMGAASDIPF